MALFKRKDDEADKKSEREKVEERREEVLARGRKFKYPLQYAKHKVVTLTIIISLFVIFAIGVFGYVMLYKVQSTDELLYRVTQVLPVSVAEIDGEKVLYSDYLLLYRSSITPIEKQGTLEKDEDADKMREYYKRESLTAAEDYTYALKLAKELGIEVTDADVDKAVDSHRTAGGVERSNETFTRILQDNFGLSLAEYRRIIYLSLVSEKVSEKIDELAVSISEEIEAKLLEGKTLSDIAKTLGDKVVYESTDGLVDRMNIDGGRASVAMGLEKGKTSARFVSNSGDGFYYVTLIDKDESSVNYSSIQIPFNELKHRLENIRKDGKVKESIKLEENKEEEDPEESQNE